MLLRSFLFCLFAAVFFFAGFVVCCFGSFFDEFHQVTELFHQRPQIEATRARSSLSRAATHFTSFPAVAANAMMIFKQISQSRGSGADHQLACERPVKRKTRVAEENGVSSSTRIIIIAKTSCCRQTIPAKKAPPEQCRMPMSSVTSRPKQLRRIKITANTRFARVRSSKAWDPSQSCSLVLITNNMRAINTSYQTEVEGAPLTLVLAAIAPRMRDAPC